MFVVRRLGHLFAYENACPHIGTPLDFMPDQFLTRDRKHLLCSTHGALFEIATGLCIHGPCKGRSLRVLPFALRDGMIVLTASGTILTISGMLAPGVGFPRTLAWNLCASSSASTRARPWPFTCSRTASMARATRPVAVHAAVFDQLEPAYSSAPRDPLQSTDFSFSRFLTPYLSGFDGLVAVHGLRHAGARRHRRAVRAARRALCGDVRPARPRAARDLKFLGEPQTNTARRTGPASCCSTTRAARR